MEAVGRVREMLMQLEVLRRLSVNSAEETVSESTSYFQDPARAELALMTADSNRTSDPDLLSLGLKLEHLLSNL